MGDSASTDIFFGIHLGTEGSWATGDYEELPDYLCGQHELNLDWDDIVAMASGVVRPDVAYSEETKPAFETYWEEKRKAVAECPVKLIMGGYERNDLAVAVRESHISSDWNDNPGSTGNLAELMHASNAVITVKGAWTQLLKTW